MPVKSTCFGLCEQVFNFSWGKSLRFWAVVAAGVSVNTLHLCPIAVVCQEIHQVTYTLHVRQCYLVAVMILALQMMKQRVRVSSSSSCDLLEAVSGQITMTQRLLSMGWFLWDPH